MCAKTLVPVIICGHQIDLNLFVIFLLKEFKV